nr:hypothetical protein [Tanacetum cinerariifolium]
MATTIEQQVALDEALVPSTQRLRIWRSNFRLPSDIQSKESTLQLVYDVLRRCPFFKAFLVIADVPEKHTVDLESFKEMLYICPRIPSQAFAELPFEEEILEFIRFLGHGATIRTLTDININKLYQPWRSFAVVSRHQNTQQYGAMLHIKLTNDEIRNTKAYKEYYACATGEAVPKPKANTRRKISGSDTSITPPTATTAPTTTVAISLRLTTAAKGKQPAKAKSTSDPSEVARTEAQKLKIVNQGFRMYPLMIQKKNSHGTLRMIDTDAQEKDGDDDEGDERSESDEESDGDETREDESFDPIPRTAKDIEDDGNGKEDQDLRISEEERLNEEEEADELYRDVDINRGRLSQDIKDFHVTLTLVNHDGQQESSSVSFQFVTSMLNPTSDACMESIFATASSRVAPLQTSTPIMNPSTIATIITISHALIPPTTIPSEVLQNLPTFDLVFRFEDRLKSLEANFSEYIQTNPFAKAVSNIPGIVHQYMNQQMTEAVRVAVPIQTNRLHDSYQRENDEFLRTIDENIKRIIKEQVKTDLSEMELKKVLIEKMEGNKSIQRSDEQKNLYMALVEAYEADKIILDTYGETDEGPFAGSDRGSKRPREGKEPESASATLKPTTMSAGRSTTGSKSRQVSASESAFAEEPVQTTCQMDEPSYPVFETDYKNIKWIEDLVPRSMWIQEPINYDKHALWGVSHWGRKRQQFYEFAVNWESALDVYSKKRIIAVMDLKIVKWHSYKHLDWITVRRDDDKLYKFKEGDFKRLRLQDIEDMLLLLVQGKLSNLTVEDRFAFNVSFRMFTRSIVIQRRVEDL